MWRVDRLGLQGIAGVHLAPATPDKSVKDGAATHASLMSSVLLIGLRTMGGCYPNDSRALGVLIAFESDVRAFLPSSDQSNLSAVSWWLHRSTVRLQSSGDASWPTEDELLAVTQRVHTRLTRGGHGGVRRNRTKVRLAVGQVHVLLRDLLLVASGLRPSCLVDCCALTTELIELLLKSAADEKLQWCALDRVRAVLLDDNVFFINTDAFVHAKMTELVSGLDHQMYVDVSASLHRPQVIDRLSDAGASRLQEFAAWTLGACKDLLASEKCTVLEWKRPTMLHATALAGILLCYPCIYDMVTDDKDDGWNEQKNCLALCPLVVVRTSLIGHLASRMSPQLEIVLQEFSTPQHLLKTEKLHLRARCMHQLQQAIDRSKFSCSSMRANVQVDTRSLPRVAL